MARQGPPVRIAGTIMIVSGLLAMVFGAGFLALGVLSGPVTGGATGEWSGLGAIVAVAGIVFASLGLAGLVSGVGVWGGRTWARVLGVILAGIVLVEQIPRLIGRTVAGDALVESILAGYVLLVLLFGWRKSSRQPVDQSDCSEI